MLLENALAVHTLTMTVNHEFLPRGSSNAPMSATCLEDRFEVLKDIGDGSFGSVALARVRTAGAHVARRGTLVCQSSFDSFPHADPHCRSQSKL